jgi:hypothetical protein
MVKAFVITGRATAMAQDVRPFRTGAAALLLLAVAILAAGIWAQMRAPMADPVTQVLSDRLVPLLQTSLPAPLGQSETVFGTLANLAGIVALAGLLLSTLRRRAPAVPADAAPVAPRVIPRRPADLRAARAGVTTAPLPQTEAPPDAPVSASAPIEPRKSGRQFQRAALMLIGSVLIGMGALYVFGRAALPVPAFPPPAPTGGLVQPALIALAVALALFAALRVIRQRRAA